MKNTYRKNVRIDEHSELLIREISTLYHCKPSVIIRTAIRQFLTKVIDENGYVQERVVEILNEVREEGFEDNKNGRQTGIRRPCRNCLWIHRYTKVRRRYRRRNQKGEEYTLLFKEDEGKEG